MVNENFKNKLKKFEIIRNESNLLESSFIEWPYSHTKNEIAIDENNWYYRNLYNNYFCFCKCPLCLYKNINMVNLKS